MLKIRLARVGKKKRPTYRFIISEAARDPYGRALEILGHYNPFSKVIEVNKERILYWISKGAQASPTVHNLLVDQKVISGEKVKASKSKAKKKKGEGAADAKTATDSGEKKDGVLADKAEKKSAEEKSPVEKPKEEAKTEEKKEKTEEEPTEEKKKESK